MRRVIAFFPRHQTSAVRMLPQVAALAKSQDLEPVVMLCDKRAMAFRDAFLRAGARVETASDDLAVCPVEEVESRYVRATRAYPGSLRAFLTSDRVAHSFPIGLWRRKVVISVWKLQCDRWISILKALGPVALMVPGDRELGFLPPLLKAAKSLGIPAAISTSNIPSLDGLGANRSGRMRFQADIASFPLIWTLWTRLQHPHQCSETSHGYMLFSPGWLVSALDTLGMLSERPWIQGGGNATHVLLDGAEKARIHARMGVPEEKIVLIGDLAYDELHGVWQRRADARQTLSYMHGWDNDRKLAVLAVPIYAEHDLMSWTDHLDALDKMAACLASKPLNVVVSLHPRSEPRRYEFLASRYGFRIGTKPLSRMVPIADLFVCGNSSTIAWAILCGIPCINLDYIDMKDRAFAECRGVIRVGDVGSLNSALDRFFLAGPSLAASQHESASVLGIFDGNAETRLLAFLRSLTAVVRALAA